MKKELLIILLLSLISLYWCSKTMNNYGNKATEEGITAEKIFNKTNEGMEANNDANQQLQDLSNQIK